MEVLVAGWIGSTNLGDELVFAGLRALARELGISVTAISQDPAHTARIHGVAAVRARPRRVGIQALRRADAMVLGGGGLIQDETSPFNLPYHLARVAAGRAARLPWVGLGLGVGPLHTGLGRRLAGTLRHATAITVRDAHSAAVLEGVGVRDAQVTADLAFHNPRPRVEVEDVLVVALRPWTGSGGHLLPVAWRRDAEATPGWYLDLAATQLDRIATATGLGVRFVAFQTDRDDAIHREVAARMTTPAELRRPTLDGVLAEVARARVVVAMRYHAAIAAVLGGRPLVAIGYSPKVDALAGELGRGARRIAWTPAGLSELADAVGAVDGNADPVANARDRLVGRAAGNRDALARLLLLA